MKKTVTLFFVCLCVVFSCKTPPVAEVAETARTIEVPSTWVVVSLLKKGNISHINVKDGVKRPEITFGKENAFGGTTGVNRFFGKYEISKTSLTIGGIGVTRMLGINEEANTNETAFLAALNKVASFEVSPRRLTLFDAKKNILMLCELESKNEL